MKNKVFVMILTLLLTIFLTSCINQSNVENNESNNDTKNSALSKYSSEEVEYARVWLHLGDTKEVDELNVKHISSGEPLNPDDETSVDYPEDVVQLTGALPIEGVVTFSSNGDGSINLYKQIPHRWDGKNPAGEEFYKNIIDNNIEQISIGQGDDKEVEKLIKKINKNTSKKK